MYAALHITNGQDQSAKVEDALLVIHEKRPIDHSVNSLSNWTVTEGWIGEHQHSLDLKAIQDPSQS